MAQTISTKFLPPTNRRGPRIKATASSGGDSGFSLTLDWLENTARIEHNHGRAAKALIKKLGWSDRAWFGGGAPGGGYIFVCTIPDDAITFSPAQSDWVRQSPKE